MKQPRIYISGPITGHSDYKERFAEAADTLRKAGWVKPVNPTTMFGWFQPVFNRLPYRLQVFIDCMVLSTCKGIYLMSDYNLSRGARLEKAVAEFLQLSIYEQRLNNPFSPLIKSFVDMGEQMSGFSSICCGAFATK